LFTREQKCSVVFFDPLSPCSPSFRKRLGEHEFGPYRLRTEERRKRDDPAFLTFLSRAVSSQSESTSFFDDRFHIPFPGNLFPPLSETKHFPPSSRRAFSLYRFSKREIRSFSFLVENGQFPCSGTRLFVLVFYSVGRPLRSSRRGGFSGVLWYER